MHKVGETVFMMTTRTLMPGTFKGIDKSGLYEIASPNGRIYTPRPENVFDAQTGAIMLMHRRAEDMAAKGYEIKVRITNASFRVVNPKKHGANGGYTITRTGDNLDCTCPSFAKNCVCKHILSVCSLLHKAAKRSADAGNIRIATRYANLAANLLAVGNDEFVSEPASTPVTPTPKNDDVVVVVPYAQLSREEQQKKFADGAKRRGLDINLDF